MEAGGERQRLEFPKWGWNKVAECPDMWKLAEKLGAPAPQQRRQNRTSKSSVSKTVLSVYGAF